jgi:hypothetical protein
MCAAWLFGSAGAGEVVAYSLQRSEICQREPRMPHRSSGRGGGRDPVEADIVERGAVAERLGASRPRPVLMDADDRVVDTIDNVDIRAVIEGRGACPVDVVGIPIRSVTPAIAIFTCPCLRASRASFRLPGRAISFTRGLLRSAMGSGSVRPGWRGCCAVPCSAKRRTSNVFHVRDPARIAQW